MTKDDFPRCRTCKYWDAFQIKKRTPKYQIKRFADSGFCVLMDSAESLDREPDMPRPMVWTEGYEVDSTHTDAEFGCILHSDLEEK